jgi:hypothetical protein
MRIMGDWMQKAFGELFADQVGQLADLAFPRADCSATTAQNVYDARRQPQRKGTSRS